MSFTGSMSFGLLLKQLRKQAGMTQRDLAAALGYSESLICSLEKAQRLPALQVVMERFVPALGLQDDPAAATALIEQAALARGQRLPPQVIVQQTTQAAVQVRSEERIDHLPSLPTTLIGRDRVINQLCHRLSGHQGRLLTLVGAPGVGKTTLALAVAERLQQHFVDGVIFTPLAAVTDALSMTTAIAALVGSSDKSGQPPKDNLIVHLRRKHLLLILDNLEQIREAAALIAELVAQCPHLCVLATSRERLHLRAEQRFVVPPLDPAAAVELFVQRAQAVTELQLTSHNHPTIAQICERLDRLPLAIELCAAQIELFSPTHLLQELQTRALDLLVDGAHDLPPQQRTLRRAIERSYGLLDAEEQTLLRTLGVFVGGFALPQMEAVYLANQKTQARSVQMLLHALIHKSLIQSGISPAGEPRFLLLETIREFALEQAQAYGEEARLRQHHYAAYLQLFRTADSHLRGAESARWLGHLEPEQDNLRAALQWTLDEAHPVEAAWLTVAANYFWHLRGHRYEESRWLMQLLPYRHQLATDLRLVVLNNFYGSALGLEEFPPVDHYCAEIMQLLENCTDPCLRSATWYFLLFAADYTHAVTVMEQSVAWARSAYLSPGLSTEFGVAADRDYILGANLWGYAKLLTDRGELARAEPIAREGLQLFRKLGNQIGIGDGLANLGRLALLQGDLVQAYRLFHEAVTIATSVRNRSMQCAHQLHLGIITLYIGDSAEAHRLLDECLRLSLALQDKVFLARNYTYLAEIALWEGKLEQAEQWLAQSLIYPADAQRNPVGAVARFFIAARVATVQRHYRRAAILFGLADQVHRQIHYVIGGPIRSLADAALATVQAALDPVVFAKVFAAGQQLSIAEAFATELTVPWSPPDQG